MLHRRQRQSAAAGVNPGIQNQAPIQMPLYSRRRPYNLRCFLIQPNLRNHRIYVETHKIAAIGIAVTGSTRTAGDEAKRGGRQFGEQVYSIPRCL